ncbi:MAG: hypothetical protein J5545_11610 [Bacteroidaceae bacterium]|nr:hypothetical protein [Bacteroidaceae bacterium]
MKKILFAFTMLLAMVACTNKPVTAVENNEESNEVAFEVAKNYFFKNDQVIPEYPKITTEEEFNKLFGMATTMGKDGKPTAIDFTKQFVLAIVLPVTDFATEINPVKVEEKGDSLLYTYDVKTGEKLSFTIQPVSIIILDKQYENKRVVLVNERETTYFPAIDRYLTDSIGSQYGKGEHCVPIHSIVRVDERHSEDILVWGDFWVFNYNQSGDTLKCVSGGSHPGLMHIRQTEKGFEVTAFDQVEDGSRYLPTAKKIFGDKFDAFKAINSDEKARERLRAEGLATYAKKNGLAVALYQDYGWPAKKLEK